MEKYMIVIRQVFELSETCLEALTYIQNELQHGYLSYTVNQLEDTILAFHAMGRSLEPMLSMFDSERLEYLNLLMWESIDVIVSAYERDYVSRAFYLVTTQIIPKFQAWKAEVENELYLYILS